MSREDNIRIAEEHLEAESKRELGRLLETLTEDCLYEESLLERPIQGKLDIERYYKELWEGFPDFTYTVTNRVADEHTVVYEMTFRGTHTGPFRGIPPTGRSGEVKGVVVFPMKDGRATGERIYIDGLSFLIQLGVLPEPKSLFGRLLFLLFRLRLAPRALWRQKR